ncbi:transcription elongation factor B polypeptide 3 [Anopheles moucheti]|uniref:transcription elongation factor B polypeptide 3 n=1 Tax=Anopheles moucheti TaxID=186751 RepID=UPI0022F0206D|nr:transcription elongation factor B polypeptide 3 [Anopheles moucheti]XP_052902176.1 transcription elongation factor B polypeptide 3 [Anopheles moucheti]
MSSIVDIINHYQTSINKSLNDTARIVHCIGKLYKLPISVRHLQDTGIGRTVNSLRKYDGEVGIAAKALVTKWKAMVAAEESDDNTANAGTQGEGADSEGRQNEDGQQRSDMSDQEEDGHNRSLADDDDEDDDGDEDEDDDDDDRGSHHNTDQDDSYAEPQLRVAEDFTAEAEGNDSNSDGEESDERMAQPEVHYLMHHRVMEPEHPLSSEDRATSSQWSDHHSSAAGSKRHSNGSSRSQHHTSTSKVPSSSGSGQKHKNGDRSDRSDRRKNEGGGHHRHSSSGGESKSHKSSSSSTDHHGSAKKSSSHGDGERHKDRSSSKHHSSSSNTNDHGAVSSSNSSSSHARKDSSHKEDRHRSKEKHSAGGSSKRHATEENDADMDAASSSKRSRKEHRTDHVIANSTMPGTSSSSPHASASTSSSHSRKDKSKGHSSGSSSSSSKRHHDKSESSRERSEESKSKSRRKDKSLSSPASNQEHNNDDSVGEDGNDGLDCSGGASFADALAMIGMPSGSKKKPSGSNKEKVKVTVMKSSTASTSANHRDSEASYSRSKQEHARVSSSSASTSVARNGGMPTASELLSQNVKLEPLPEASEIVESLPMISPHYRPMPLNQTVMECVFLGGQSGRNKGRPLTEEEALGQSMQSKNMRTKVYSGQKTNAKGVIPTLYELCIRLLQDHIDEIGATGGIPFYILKPVLERANPTQLLHLEHFNPHFVEDSDVLWEQHCKRTFRSKQRNEEELETWREMFLRCSEERDAKLRSLTQNIKLSQEQAAAPIRKTQLAYVDSAVKPPRNVISKQVKYGTARAPVVSPAARVAALKAGNVTQAGDARLRVAASVRDNAQAQVFQPTKPRKAPMMAKVLSSMKGFKTSFRR